VENISHVKFIKLIYLTKIVTMLLIVFFL